MTHRNRPASVRIEDEVKEAKRLEEETLYTSKAHFNDAATDNRWAVFLGTLAAILAATAAGLTLVEWEHRLTAILIVSVLSAALSGYLTIQNPGAHAATHHAAGVRFQEIKDESRRLAYRASEQSIAEVRAQVDQLSQRKSVLNDSFPQPSERGYRRAKHGIDNGESSFKVDGDSSESVLEEQCE